MSSCLPIGEVLHGKVPEHSLTTCEPLKTSDRIFIAGGSLVSPSPLQPYYMWRSSHTHIVAVTIVRFWRWVEKREWRGGPTGQA